MTTRELQRNPSTSACTAKVRVTAAGETMLVARRPGASAYGPVEIAWYPDRLEITALGAGRAAITEEHPGRGGDDFVVEIRPPGLDELTETVPGAD
jgi:hypothetical protein